MRNRCAMYCRQVLFPADHSISRLRVIGKWITIFMLAVPMGVITREAWDHGVIVAILLAGKSIVLALWNMLCDFAAVCIQFVRFVFRQQS